MYLSTSTSTEDFQEMYLSTFQVLYKLYLSTDVLKYKVLLPGSDYVTMQITFPIPEFARRERNLHYDVAHVTTKWVSRLVLDHAIAAIQTSR